MGSRVDTPVAAPFTLSPPTSTPAIITRFATPLPTVATYTHRPADTLNQPYNLLHRRSTTIKTSSFGRASDVTACINILDTRRGCHPLRPRPRQIPQGRITQGKVPGHRSESHQTLRGEERPAQLKAASSSPEVRVANPSENWTRSSRCDGLPPPLALLLADIV